MRLLNSPLLLVLQLDKLHVHAPVAPPTCDERLVHHRVAVDHRGVHWDLLSRDHLDAVTSLH